MKNHITTAGAVPDTVRLLSGTPAGWKMLAVPGGVLSPLGCGALTTNDMTPWAGPWGISFARNPKIAVNQTRCEYIPHVVIVPVGSSLDISNSDPVLHNVHGYSNQKTLFNIAQPIKRQHSTIRESVFSDPGFIDLICDAGHPWMSGIVVVASYPYYSITGEDGKYRLGNIPPGKYRLVMWHEGIIVTSTEKQKGKIKKYVYETPCTVECEVTVTGGRDIVQNFDLVVR